MASSARALPSKRTPATPASGSDYDDRERCDVQFSSISPSNDQRPLSAESECTLTVLSANSAGDDDDGARIPAGPFARGGIVWKRRRMIMWILLALTIMGAIIGGSVAIANKAKNDKIPKVEIPMDSNWTQPTNGTDTMGTG